MNVSMGKNQSNVICLSIFLLLTLVYGGQSHATPAHMRLSPSTYLAARTDNAIPSPGQIDRIQKPDEPLSRIDLPRAKWTGKWLSSSPPLLGFNPVTLETTVEKIGGMEGVYSLLVVREGYLAVERYFREGNRTKPHNLKSASKSILSALVGIAIDEDTLEIDQPISDILPQAVNLSDPRKGNITVRHLLTMTSGLGATSYQAYNAWITNSDWIKTALAQPLVAEPGTRFQYSTGNTHLLSAVLTEATGMSTQAFATRKLFDPMGIKVHGWSTDPHGIYQGGNNLSLIPRDMAKLGQLYLDGGRFGSRQIVPKRWVDASTRKGRLGEHEVYGSYGYLWYVGPHRENAFVAVGYGGQYIYVSPAYQSVVVVTSTLISKGRAWEKTLFGFIQDGIFGSIQTDQPKLLLAAGMNDSGIPRFDGTMADPPGQSDSRPLNPSSLQQQDNIVRSASPMTVALAQPMGQTTKHVILRSGPDRESQRLGLVPPGEKVKILDTQGKWHLVQFDDKTGWLFGAYVKVTLPDKPALPEQSEKVLAAEELQPRETTSAAVSEGGQGAGQRQQGLTRVRLKLREGPSTSDPAITTLEAGSTLAIIRQDGLWLEVAVDNRRGWVSARYVRIFPRETTILAERPVEVKPVEQPSVVPEPESTPLMAAVETPPPPTVDLKKFADLIGNLRQRQHAFEKKQQQVEGEIGILRKELAMRGAVTGDSDAALKKLTAALATEKKTIESLNSALETAAVDRAELKTGLTAHQINTEKALAGQEQLGRDLASAREQFASIGKTLELLQTNRKNLTWNLTKVIEELESQRESSAQAATERKAASSDLAKVRQELESRREASAQAASVQKAVSSDLAKVREDLEKQRWSTAEIMTGRKTLSTEIAGVRSEITAFGKTLEGIQNTREGIRTELGKLGQDVRAQKDAATRGVAERDSLTSELSKVRKELEDQRRATGEIVAGRKTLSSEIAGVRSDLTAIQDIRESVKTELSKLGQDLKAQQDVATRGVAERDGLKSELAKVTEALKNQHQALTKTKAAREALSSDLALLQSQITAFSDTLVATQTTRDMLGQDLTALRENLKTQQETATQAASERDGLKTELVRVREELENQRQTAALSEGDRKLLTSELAGVRSELATLSDTLKTAQAAREETMTELHTLRKALKSQQEAAIHGIAERDHLAAELTKAREALEKQQLAVARPEISPREMPPEPEGSPPRLAAVESPPKASPKSAAPTSAEEPETKKTQLPPPPGKEPASTVAPETKKTQLQPPPGKEPAPTVRKKTVPPLRPADFEAIDLFLRSWAEAWARKDVKAYLAHYAENFQTPGGISRASWSKQRKQRILKPAMIEIAISNIRAKQNGASTALVNFNQRYQSSVYVDRVTKTLELRWEKGMWKIYTETSKAK